jgi:hypothetical protein
MINYKRLQKVRHRLQSLLIDFIQKPVLYPPWVIPYGIHGMEGGIHGMEGGIHGMSDGFQMDSMEFLMDSISFPDGFHTFSRWIPYGMGSWNNNFTLIPCHFQGGIHME